MDIHSVIESFAEAWVAANTQTPLTEAAAASITSDQVAQSLGRTSIPIRCLIERQETGNNNKASTSDTGSSKASTGQTTDTPRRSPSSVTSPPPSSSCTSSSLEQDTFAIIPSNIPFIDLVKATLMKLGYSTSEAVGAKGLIQVRNWKSLTFDQITDSQEATVCDILGDISSFVTLRIRLFKPKGSAAHEVKDKLLQILLANSQNHLVESGCPIDSHLLTALCGRNNVGNKSNDNEIPEETRKKFDQWYLQQVFNHYRQVATLAAAHQQQQQHPSTLESGDGRRTSMNGQTLQAALENPVGLLQSRLGLVKERKLSVDPCNTTSSPNSLRDKPLIQSDQSSHFVRTRIRTSFDPELELPKLHKWFAENQHPTRGQIQLYVNELNSLDSRRGRKPLDINNVVYWFKNARAAHKRQELKFVNGSVGGSSGGNVTDHDNNNDCQNKNMNEVGQELGSSGHNGRNSDVRDEECDDSEPEDESGEDRTEDDNSSQFSHTLDLSVNNRNKRRRSDSLDSGNHAPITGDAMHTVKDEAMSEDDEEDEGPDSSDIESEKFFEKFYTHGLPTGLPFYSAANGSGNLMINGQSGIPFSVYGSNKIAGNGNNNHNPESPEAADARRIRRSRTFIDPMTEVPRLEQWFAVNTHPTHSQIVRYTDDLNRLQYRMKFPKLEPKNIQFWFKNRRAKFKRLSLPPSSSSHLNASVSSTATSSTHGLSPLGENPIPPSSSPPTSSSHGPNTSSSSSVTSSSCSISPKSQGNNLSVSSSSPSSCLPPVTSALNIERLIGN